MLPQPSIGDYVAQVLNFEEDTLRLLQDVQQFNDAGHARTTAIYKAFFSSNPSAIEKRAILAANNLRQTPDLHSCSDATVPAGSLPSKDQLRGDLILVLFSIDTTWRFDTFNNRVLSPSLSWPAIRKLFQHGTSVEADLILKDYHCRFHVGPMMPPPAQILHVEILSDSQCDIALLSIAQALRQGTSSWTRQLTFVSDPAQAQAQQRGMKHVLMQEFDSSSTAESVSASIDYEVIRHLSGEDATEIAVRIFTLVGSGTHDIVAPSTPSDLVIRNQPQSQAGSKVQQEGESYFGLAPERYVHI